MSENLRLAETTSVPAFEECIKDESVKYTLDNLEVLQINVGRLCNLACKHCHVEAGPARTEVMSRETLEACLQLYKEWGFKTVDITGGAPEMNPHFEWFVDEVTKVCDHVIVRSNLVIMKEEKYAHIPQFLADRKVEIVASLPYYRAKETDRQRGDGVFDGVIEILQKLNSLGYGKDPELVINLVYNPNGAFFPPEQGAMEKEYKQRLMADFGIVFNNLFTITNNPTGRFAGFLKRSGNLESYLQKLYGAFNAATLPTMMCRNQLSVGWDGRVYDCDFNQAADLPVLKKENIADLVGKAYTKRKICFGKHCYGCTAGQGSSCGGATE